MLKACYKYFLAFAVCLTFFSAEVYGQCLTISVSGQDVNCAGGNDGQITVQVLTGTPNFTYELYYDDGGLTLLGRVAGTSATSVTFTTGNGTLTEPGAEGFGIPANGGVSQYRVFVIASGAGSFVCERKTQFVTIGEPANGLTAVVNNVDPDCDPLVGSGNGNITITPSGGTAPYTYLWSDGATTQNRTNIDAGNYSVTITDDNGCTFPLNATVPVVTQANAGPDQTICADNTALAGNAPVAGEIGTWTVVSGSGVFTNPNSPTTSVGSLGFGANVFEWRITDAPPITCTGTAATVTITRATPASVDAGPPQTVCTGGTVTLAGTFGGSATSATWSAPTGDGSFDNPALMNAVYTPGPNDITAGSVTLVLTTNDPLGPCPQVSDNVVITINTTATVDAGPPQTICSGSTVTLAGTFGGSATGISWSTAGDGTFNNTTAQNAIYTPGPNDRTAGTVVLTIETDDPAGPCLPATDNVTITINPVATVDAGAPQTICGSGTATLAGVIGGAATGATWTTAGDGTFNNATQLNAIYTPGPNDRTTGSVTLTLTTNDPNGPCLQASDNVVITLDPVAIVDAGSPQTICAGSTIALAGTIGGGATSATWTGGTGTFNPNNTTLNAVYTPSAAEITAGSVTLTLTTNDPAGLCGPANDFVLITISPVSTVDAGAPQTICAGNTVTLAGVVGGSATGGIWSGGTGTFAPNNTTLNAVYTPSAAERTAGTVTLTLTTTGPCAPAADNVTITITPAATVDAGLPQTICAGNTVTLAGVIGGSATGATWSGGTGTFAPNTTTLNAVYTPSAAETTAGTVTLTLTTTGPCATVSDNVTITINPAATVDAGPAQTICAGNTVTLAGLIGGSATGATWSGGAGTFTPNNSTLNAVYTPSAGEIAAGTVTLTLTTTGPCAATADNVTITISPAATVDAGPAQAICAGNTVTLAGTVGGSATGGTWSGGGGTFNPNNTTLNAVYTPSAAEVTAGTVTLTLTTTGPCATAADNVTITISPLATVDAGPAQTICSGNTATLAGVIGGSAAGATWSGGTGTFSPNNTTLNAVYTPSAAEVTAGTVTLTLTTNGPCAPVADNVTITISPTATVDAGPAQNICAGNTVSLAGIIGGSATGATWSGGTGTFNPNNTTLNAVYTPSAAEVAAGTVTLTLTTSGPCAVASDNVTITISPAATVDAGPAQSICAGNTVTLAGTVGGAATGGTWSGGTGTFNPNNTTLNAIYTPGAAEVAAGSVTLTLTSSGPCAAATDNVTITISPAATVDAGPAQTICAGNTVTLAGVIGGSATGATWSGGSGTFNPDNTTLNAAYTPSAAEVAAGTVTLTLTTTGPCAAAADNVTITISPAATVDAGPAQAICAGNTVTLAGVIGGSATGGTWSGGTGTFNPNNTTLNAVYTPSAAEVTAGTVTLTLTTAGPCTGVADNVTITISPAATVDAGPAQTICAGSTVTLAGTVGGGATGGTWSGGSGTFNPNNATLNAVYTPSAAEVTAGTVTLTLTTTGPCAGVADNVTITISPAATADAGAAQTICEGDAVTLAGAVGGAATGGTWSGGTGNFTPDANSPTTIYTPSAAEIAAGTVTLTLSTTGPCAAVTDDVIITINPAPTADAGSAQIICAGNTATLAGSIGGSATSAAWSGGTGTFAPNNTTLNAVYTPSAAEVTAGLAILTLTTDDPDGGGPCTTATATVVITISNGATADAGPAQTICAGNTATLAGTFTGASGITWSTAGDGTFNNADAPGAIYTPGPNDIVAGTVTLTLATDGPCAPVSDDVVITINPAATVDAGTPQTICAGTTVTLAGAFSGSATGLQWTTAGDGTFSDATDENAVYTPGTNDIAAGSVVLTATATGTCSGVTDNVTITINQLALADAGPDQTVCAGTTATLAGVIGGSATSASWSGGAGTFSPNANTLNAVYTPTAAEITAGTVTLTLTTNNPAGPCPADTDDVILTFSPVPGDEVTFGTETWIGYVYNDASSPAPPVSNINFSTAKYRGYIEETEIGALGFSSYNTATDAFDMNLSNSVPLAGPNVCGSFTNDYSVRFRMRKTFTAGIYTFTVGGDDGIRLTIDGNPVAGVFTEHAYQTYTGTVCLTAGTHDLVLEYFERGGFSRVSFDYDVAPAPDVTTPVAICVGSPSAPTLSASTTDPAVVDFRWYAEAGLTTLLGSGANFTPAIGTNPGEIDLSVPGTTSFFVAPVYACGQGQAAEVVVDVVNGATLTVNNPLVCEAAGVVDLTTFVTAVPAGGAFTFAGHPNITGNNFDPSGLSGPINITVDYSVGACVAPQATLTVNVTNTSVITVPASTVTVCQGSGLVDLNTLVSATPAGGDLVFTGSAAITGDNFDPASVTGPQTITVNYALAGGTCAATQQQFTIDVAPSAAINVTNVTVCPNGGTVDLLTLVSGAPAGGTFTFSGTGVTGTTFNPAAQAGTTVTINVQYTTTGCAPVTASLQIIVRANGDPTCGGGGPGNCGALTSISIVPIQPTCPAPDGGQLTFNLGSSSFDVLLEKVGDASFSQTERGNAVVFDQLKAGVYRYTIKDLSFPANTCTSNLYTLERFTEVSIDSAYAIADANCFGGNGNLRLAAQGTTTGKYFFSYVIDGVESAPAEFTPGALLPGGIPADDDDFIIIKVDESAALACPDTIMVQVRNANPQVVATFDITAATCNGNDGAITNIAASGGAGGPYEFSLDGTNFQTETEFLAIAGGTYTLTVRDASGCTSDLAANVTFPGFVGFNVTPASATCDNNGLSGKLIIRFNDPGTYQAGISSDPLVEPTEYVTYTTFDPLNDVPLEFDSLGRGTYFVFAKTTTALCPTRQGPFIIDGVYAVDFDIVPICNNNQVSISLTNITGEPGIPFEVQVFRKFTNIQVATVSFASVPVTGSVLLEYADQAFLRIPDEYQIRIVQVQSTFCLLTSELKDFQTKVQLTAQIGAVSESYPDILNGNMQVHLFNGGTIPYEVRIQLDSAAVGGQSYQTDWEEVERNSNLQFERLYDNIPAGRYKVEVMDSVGCVIELVGRVPLDTDIFIPNIFTPNEDGFNDVFFIRNLPEASKLVITNRWGKQVYSSGNYQNSWNAEDVSDGIYFYRLKPVEGEALTGWVEVLRGTKP